MAEYAYKLATSTETMAGEYEMGGKTNLLLHSMDAMKMQYKHTQHVDAYTRQAQSLI